MIRAKMSSDTYEAAFKRMAACKSIDPDFDFGNGLTQSSYQTVIEDVKSALDDYNTSLSIALDKLNSLEDKEFTLRSWNSRILNAVASGYSKYASLVESQAAPPENECDQTPPAQQPA
jgi:hypothetical protein